MISNASFRQHSMMFYFQRTISLSKIYLYRSHISVYTSSAFFFSLVSQFDFPLRLDDKPLQFFYGSYHGEQN